jgi:hypothetical protein
MERLSEDPWVYGNPMQPGWYATLHSWDSDEGAFPDAWYWNGTRWVCWHEGPGRNQECNLPIYAHSPEFFANVHQAELWANDNCP